MKTFIVFLLAFSSLKYAVAQTCTATITASGPTTFCQGGSVVLTAHPTSNAWTRKADFGGSARLGATGFAIGTKGYIGTGYDGGYKNDFWEFDPSTNVWTQKANYSGAGLLWATGFCINNKGYIGTGVITDFVYTNEFWQYDPIANVWTRKANFGGAPRRHAVGFNIGNKGYIGTGVADGFSNDFWEYDPPSDKWTRKADFVAGSLWSATGFSIGIKGYIGLGRYTTGSSGEYSKDFWEYDPSSNIWTKKADFVGYPRIRAVGFGIGNKGYIGTGLEDSLGYHQLKNDFWQYEPISNKWTRIENFGGIPRDFSVGFSIGNKGFIGLGENYITNVPGEDNKTYKKDFWEFDPSKNYSYSWSTGATTPSINVTESGSYTVTITNGVGCTKTSVAKIVTVRQKADIVAVTASLNPLCTGSRTTLTASGVKGYHAVVTWFTGPGGTGTNLGTGITLNNKPAGTYYARVTAGCGSPVEASLMVSNVSLPTATITASGPTTFCQGGNVVLSANSSSSAWTKKADFGGDARTGATAFSIGTKGYIGTGRTISGLTNDFWEFTPSTNAWTQKADFGGTGVTLATGFCINNKGYIGTGDTDGYVFSNQFWEYDPITNIWTRKANFDAGAFRDVAAFSIGNKGYIGTGIYLWEYDPSSDKWTEKAVFGGYWVFGDVKWEATGFSIGNKGYIGLGRYRVARYSDWVSDLWEYDPSLDTWERKADFLGTPRIHSSGFNIGNRGYMGTGYDEDGLSHNLRNDFEEYDPATNTWTQKENFGGSPRWSAVGFSIGNKGYIGTGGDSLGFIKDFWEFDPSKNYSYAWSTSAATPTIPVKESGTYTVTITNGFGCTSTSNPIRVSVRPSPPTPIVTVVNKCGDSKLSTTDNGNLLWSNGARNASITVNQAGTYSVTRTQNGCTSAPGVGTAAPKKAPSLAASNVTVYTEANNCSALVSFGSNVTATGIPTPTLLYSIGLNTIYPPRVFQSGSTHVHVAAINSCGISMKTFLVNVVDRQNPAITCKPNATRTVTSSHYKVVGREFDANASDNCGPYSLMYRLSGATVIPFNARNITLDKEKLNPGITYITWKATDESENNSTCNTTVNIIRSHNKNGISTDNDPIEKSSNNEEANQEKVSFTASIIPNPSSNFFTIQLKSESNETFSIKVNDVAGRMIEQKTDIPANSMFKIGNSYQPGVYSAEIIQGKQRITLQLVKEVQ
jgi:hypothetical protein